MNIDVSSRTLWLVFILSALGLELSALYFQYVLKLEPCIMCIYQRVALWAIVTSGIVGFIGCKRRGARFVSYVLWSAGAIWGGIIAYEHVQLQQGGGSIFARCELFPNFPSWAPLHQWVPFLFEARGDCGEITWSFMGWSMPETMMVVFSTYTVTLFLVLISEKNHNKREKQKQYY